MNRYIIIIFLFTKVLFAQQSAKVTYKIHFDLSWEQASLKEKLGDMYDMHTKRQKAINKQLSEFNFLLLFNQNESLYYWEEEMKDEATSSLVFNLAKIAGGGNALHYSNRKDSLYMVQFKDVANGKFIRETSNLYKKDWQVYKDIDTILGYPVIQAVKGKEKVWFTPHIPVPFGPVKAGGFNGLVLKYQYGSRIFEATEIRFYKKPIKIKKPNKGVLRTEEEGRAERIKNIKF